MTVGGLSPDFRYGHATFHPRGMTADEFREGCYRARIEIQHASVHLHAARSIRDANLRDPYRAGLYLPVERDFAS